MMGSNLDPAIEAPHGLGGVVFVMKTAIKLTPRRGLVFIVPIAVVLALAAVARGADPPAPMPDAAVAPAPNTSSPPDSGTVPSLPDFGSQATREESSTVSSLSSSPNMIGDFGGGPTLFLSFNNFGTEKTTTVLVPSPGASILGRQRFADNDCTLPTDRIFGDYSFFHDAQLGTPSDASRFVPGFEKTFLEGRMSVEMRFPMGDLASSDFSYVGSSVGTTAQFGDIQVIIKSLLFQNETWALGAGMGVSVPTAAEVSVASQTGSPMVTISNESTHLLPYFALLVQPNESWFGQAFIQMDVAANGNAVAYSPFGTHLNSVGTFYDQTLIFADVSVGRWLYRDPMARLSGLAAVVEAHYTGGLNAPSAISTPNFLLTYGTASYNVLDLVVGAHAVMGDTTVTLGFATPVTNDRGFDGELRLFVNRRF
jgi:hypothetical protein